MSHTFNCNYFLTGGNVKQSSLTDNRSVTKKYPIQRQDCQIKKPFTSTKKDIPSIDKKPFSRPSMIPKLARPSTSGYRIDSSEKISVTEKNCTTTNSLRSKLPVANASSSSLIANEATNISVKMLDLKERLKQTTSLLRNKINSSTKTDGEVVTEGCSSASIITNYQEPKTIFQEINESVYRIETIALNISPHCDLYTKKCLLHLLTKVNEIKEIAKQIVHEQNENSESLSVNDEGTHITNSKSSQTKDKDNRIHIKFMQSKEKNERKLKKDPEKQANTESSTVPTTQTSQVNKISENKVGVISFS